MLEAHELAAQRGDAELFAGIDFALEPGAVLLVRGANGSGKTTLLRILASVTRPAAGGVFWCGNPVGPFDAALRANALFIGHAPALKDELTTEENLASLVSLHGADAGHGALIKALDGWSLSRQRMLPARVLSEGQRRRISLARLQLVPRTLWLLDEPAAALDDGGVSTLARILSLHAAVGGIAVIATHQDLPLAAGVGRSLRLE